MKRREPLTNTQLLMFIAIGIFVVMYGAAMIILSGAFLKWKNLVDLLNDNAYLIIISCALTVVMIGGGINISVGGVIGLTVMSCVLFLNGPMSQLGGSAWLSVQGRASWSAIWRFNPLSLRWLECSCPEG